MGHNIPGIKDLASRYTPEEIELCITEQLEKGHNVCIRGQSAKAVLNELAGASLVKQLMQEKGMPLSDALRELARRVRQVYHYSLETRD
ncbi:MAG: hypothetical protein M0Z52_14060 [Actinomycetota bacterium]|nr:hypothetical protein [Actinomycetota bacterium]